MRLFFVSKMLMVVFLSYCIVMQYNDPDALIWILLYGMALLLTLVVNARRFVVAPLLLLAALCYGIGSAYYAPFASSHWMRIEEGRESMGLFICMLWMLILFGARQYGSNHAEPGDYISGVR